MPCVVTPARPQRLFFALWPDARTRKALSTALDRLALPPSARRVIAANLHLTLVFLGSVPVERYRCLEQAAAQVQGRRFTLRLEQIGHWPQPRILWLGPARIPPALTALVTALYSALAVCDVFTEARPYRPHITVARNVRQAEAVTIPPLTWRVAGFSLLESRPAPGGVRYHPLASWALAGC